jgi:hypothetical protein
VCHEGTLRFVNGTAPRSRLDGTISVCTGQGLRRFDYEVAGPCGEGNNTALLCAWNRDCFYDLPNLRLKVCGSSTRLVYADSHDDSHTDACAAKTSAKAPAKASPQTSSASSAESCELGTAYVHWNGTDWPVEVAHAPQIS